MGKIPVAVSIPAIGQCHDFLIPATMAVRDVIKLIVNILVSEYGVSNNISDIALFDEKDRKIMRTEYSFQQLGVTAGAKLILV